MIKKACALLGVSSQYHYAALAQVKVGNVGRFLIAILIVIRLNDYD
jgi:hypothetical protein